MVPCDIFGTPPGYWTDDSSMAFCIAESFVRLGKYDRADIANNFVRWLQKGFWSSLPHAFDVGDATHEACCAIARSGSLVTGEERSQGNCVLLRHTLSPAPLAGRGLSTRSATSRIHLVESAGYATASSPSSTSSSLRGKRRPFRAMLPARSATTLAGASRRWRVRSGRSTRPLLSRRHSSQPSTSAAMPTP